MLKVNDLVKYYGKNIGIEGLSFNLSKGEILGIIGTNGSGKTTTFRLLLRLLLPDKGTITLNDHDLEDLDNKTFGYLPEERSVYRDLKVAEQISFLAKLKQINDNEITERLSFWLNRLEIDEYRNRKIKELSKGNQQKVQLICALIHDPLIVILDEPLTGLDIINVRLFKKIINELKQAGKMVMISSHQYEYIEEFCEKIILLKKGKVNYYGTVSDIKQLIAVRYITLVTYFKKDYLLCDGVIHQEDSGNMIRLELENEIKAKKLFKQLLKDKEIVSLKLELPTLGDVIDKGFLL